MIDDDTPVLTVDWESGEGRIDIGNRLDDAPAGFLCDVLNDWKAQIESMLDDAAVSADPEAPQRTLENQRLVNARRRRLCDRLSGQTILLAEPMANGDVLLHLGSGDAVALYARREDVKLDLIGDVDAARRFAAEDSPGDWYLRETPHG